jgi:hypothetical protein
MFKLITQVKNCMTNFVSRLTRVLAYYQGERQTLLDRVAELREQLAAALADDVADDEAVAAAQAEALAAREVAEAAAGQVGALQELVDADVAEDAALDAALAEVEAQIPPVEEVEVPSAEG